MLHEDGIFKCYYAVINDWKIIHNVPYPIYNIWYTTSPHGENWVRQDEQAGLYKSESGWDSEMACYPVKLTSKEKTYLFYNGNGMGKTGVGYARLIEN